MRVNFLKLFYAVFAAWALWVFIFGPLLAFFTLFAVLKAVLG